MTRSDRPYHRLLRDIFGDRRGGIAVSFALSLPVVLAAIGLASDYVMLTKVRTDLQVAADSAAVAGAARFRSLRPTKTRSRARPNPMRPSP